MNHTKKVMKNAIQLKCRTFIFPVKDSRLNFSVDIVIPGMLMHLLLLEGNPLKKRADEPPYQCREQLKSGLYLNISVADTRGIGFHPVRRILEAGPGV